MMIVRNVVMSTKKKLKIYCFQERTFIAVLIPAPAKVTAFFVTNKTHQLIFTAGAYIKERPPNWMDVLYIFLIVLI